MDKLMIEAAINELSTKEQNPHVPYGPEEVARDDIGLIRKECDAILYPTYPGRPPREQRIGHVLALAGDPQVRLELATLDVGSTNRPVGYQGRACSGRYLCQQHDELVYFLRELRARGVACSLGVRDVGHMRHVAAYREMGLAPDPLAIKIFLSDTDAHGPYPDARGLMMYLDMVPKGAVCHWFTAEDNPRLDGKTYANAEQVEIAVQMAHQAGREVATPAEARRMLGMAAQGETIHR